MKHANSSSSEVYIVETQAQARLLTDPASVMYFKPFLAATRPMAEVATELNCPISTLHYRVTQFVKHGLLMIVRRESRKGRAIKHYRSVKDIVFIPFNLTPYATLQEGIAEQLSLVWQTIQSGLAQLYYEQGAQGRKLYRDAHGLVLTDLNSRPEATDEFRSLPDDDCFYRDITLRLTTEQATRLNKKLELLFLEVYEASAVNRSKAAKDYVLQAALVPQG